MLLPYDVIAQRLPYTGTGEDPRGNTIHTWGAAETITGCAFDPGTSQEPFEPGRDAVETRPRLFAPNGTVVTAQDKFIVAGKTYTVEGDPAAWDNPFTGTQFPVEINLRRVDG